MIRAKGLELIRSKGGHLRFCYDDAEIQIQMPWTALDTNQSYHWSSA